MTYTFKFKCSFLGQRFQGEDEDPGHDGGKPQEPRRLQQEAQGERANVFYFK